MRSRDRVLLCVASLLGIMIPVEGAFCVKVIAHRGDSFHCPENTIPSFRSAVEKQADLVELDARMTKDGVLVVFHDSELDKKTNAPVIFGSTGFSIEKMKWNQIRGLDAGSWKNKKFAGEAIPTLEEALKVIQEGGTTLLERKTGSALQYAKLLERLGYTKNLVVQAFDWDFLAALRTWNPEIPLAALWYEDVQEERLEDLHRAGITIAVWDHEKINKASMALFRKHRLEVWCYTVDDPKEWRRLVDLGIDGIITDKPAELRAWLEENQ